MKCAICGKKTTYEKSVGRETFLVCNDCYFKGRVRKIGKKEPLTLDEILDIGFRIEEMQKIVLDK